MQRTLKLLNIIQCTNFGGMEQASLRLMTGLRNLGVKSKVISLHKVGGLGPLLDRARIPHQGLRYCGPAGVGIFVDLCRILREHEADRVIMTGPHLVALLAMKAAGRKGSFVAVHFHHTGVKSAASWRMIYWLALDRFRWVTFPADFVREEACAIYPPLRQRSITLRNPQEKLHRPSDALRRAARLALGLAESDFVVGNAGWLIQRKRFDVFLQVAGLVSQSAPDAVFLIAGGGPEEDRLRHLAENLGIGGRVHWIGWQEDMSNFRNSLDVLLFNTDWDALGLTPQETVAMGIPLVASVQHGGLREVLDDETAAKVLENHDAGELARQVLDIRADPTAALTRAAQCRQHLLRITDPATIAHAHFDLLQ